MKPMSLTTPESIAREYGGNKQKIAEAARLGLLDPTAAVMAGMFIDKMRAAATAEQAQNTTVAQDILGGGLQALPTPQQQQVPPMPAQGAMQAQQPQQSAPVRPELMQGVAALPTGNVGEYAGGGIVAFGTGGDTEEDERRRATPLHEYAERGGAYSNPESLFVPTETGMEVFDVSEPRREIRSTPFAPDFTMGARTPQERLAAQLAFPPSTIGKATKEAPPDLRIPSRGSSKTRNRLIDPEFRTDDPVKIAAEKIKILQGELENQKQALAIAKAPDEKTRAEANIKEIQREISIASKGLKGAKVKPSAAKPDSGIVQLPPDDPRAKALYDERMRRDAGVKELPQDFVGQARRITEGVYPASEKPTELTVDTAFEQSKKFLDKAGVDLNAFKKQREDIEEERRGFAKDKEEAKTMRILEAAAGILSGTSPFAAVNIGKGMTPAIQGLGSDIKEFQKNERALRAAERQLYIDEQKFNLTRASDAQAQMLKSQDRVDKYNQNKAGLIGDLTKSLVSVAGQKDVARVYTEGNIELQRMRELAPPDIVKLSDRLKADMPGKSERERLEAAADILYPGRGLSAVIGAESKASQAINEEFQNQLFTDKKLQETYKKANAGDPAAQREIDAVRKSIRDRIYANLPALSSARGGVGAAPQIGGATMPGQFSVTAPNGKVYNFPSKEQADAFRAQIGG
jgi:hypothetical protein